MSNMVVFEKIIGQGGRELCLDGGQVTAVYQQFVVIAVDGNGRAVYLLHLNHAAAGRNGRERMRNPRVRNSNAVHVGVSRPVAQIIHLNGDAGRLNAFPIRFHARIIS